MKYILAILCLCASLSLTAQSQLTQKELTSITQRAEAYVSKMDTQLNFTEDQKTKVKEILTNLFVDTKTMSGTIESSQLRAKIIERRATADDEINAILTTEQRKSFESVFGTSRKQGNL